MSRKLQERMHLKLVELEEHALERDVQEQTIKDVDYQQYRKHAGFAGSAKEAAKFHQKAGFRAAELGHHKRAERHFNLAGELGSLHRLGITSTPSMLARGMKKRQYKV